MHTSIYQILVGAGLPEPCCPNCRTEDWSILGRLSEGEISVSCDTCSRSYISMTAAERYSYYAMMAGASLKRDEMVEMYKWHERMLAVWFDYDRLRSNPSLLVCVSEGSSDWGGIDVAPF